MMKIWSGEIVMKRFHALLLIAFLFFCGLLDVGILMAQDVSPAEMEYIEVRNERNERIKFSRLIMGTDHIAQEDWYGDTPRKINEQYIHELLDEAARLGINLFDTSPIYVGDIEYKLGKWMQKYRLRNPGHRVYALSKGGSPSICIGQKNCLKAKTHTVCWKCLRRKI